MSLTSLRTPLSMQGFLETLNVVPHDPEVNLNSWASAQHANGEPLLNDSSRFAN